MLNKTPLANDNGENTNTEPSNDNPKDSGIIESKNSRHKIQCLTIIGQIEGHTVLPPQTKSTKYEHVIPQLVSIEEDNTIDGLLILLNTIGGDVEAGLAIAEMISGMSKPAVSLVLGGGAQYRGTYGRCGRIFFYSTQRNNDHSPDTNERSCYRDLSDV